MQDHVILIFETLAVLLWNADDKLCWYYLFSLFGFWERCMSIHSSSVTSVWLLVSRSTSGGRTWRDFLPFTYVDITYKLGPAAYQDVIIDLTENFQWFSGDMHFHYPFNKEYIGVLCRIMVLWLAYCLVQFSFVLSQRCCGLPVEVTWQRPAVKLVSVKWFYYV